MVLWIRMFSGGQRLGCFPGTKSLAEIKPSCSARSMAREMRPCAFTKVAPSPAQ